MAKQNRAGQAAILSQLDYEKILNQSSSPTFDLIFNILRYTGERAGATLQLDVMNVYANPYISIPRDEIIFPRSTRKKSPEGKAFTREVPISRNLKAELQRYVPPMHGYLFPSPADPSRPLSIQSLDRWLRRCCQKAGLARRGISTHSPRRTFITYLAEQGVPIKTIQKITGHTSLESLQRYIEVSPDAIKSAVELL